MNTILPKFVDFNNKTAFRPIKQIYNKVDLHVFNIIAIIIFVILLADLIYIWHSSIQYLVDYFWLSVIGGMTLMILVELFHFTSSLAFRIIEIILAIMGISIISVLLNKKWRLLLNEHKLNIVNIYRSVLIMIGTLSIMLIGDMNLNNENDYLDYQDNVSDYNISGFKITNTNLMALRYASNPNDHEDDKTLNPVRNYHKNNYYVYVDLANPRPKGINNDYLTCKTPINTQTMKSSQTKNNSNRKMDIYYLGQMKNGNFIPNYKNISVVHAFMDYQKYIKAHQLESRFKHRFSFELSYKYLADDENPTLMVVGDNGFTLHYKNAKEFSYSNIVQSEKE